MTGKIILLLIALAVFTAPAHADSIEKSVKDLTAGRVLTEKTLRSGNIKIRTYFSEKNSAYADEYLRKSADYIKMYEDMLGRYPFSSFSVVEVEHPVGYAYDGVTALGSMVIPLPFITETSLGHEILHQWFGSEVDIDYEAGNWAEGITTYLADYYYAEQKWEGKEYRKNSLVQFGAYSDNETDFPLSEFRSRHGRAGSVVGYNKSMMFFHMLRRTYGHDKFIEAARLFIKENRSRKASWADWKRAFVQTCGDSAAKYFDAWITAKGLPEYSADNITAEASKGVYVTSFKLVNPSGLPARIPVSVHTAAGQSDFLIDTDAASSSYSLETETEPYSIEIDPYYDVPRQLADSEIPPVLSAYLGSSSKTAVIGSDEFKCLAEMNGQGTVTRTKPEDFRMEDFKDSSVLIAGADKSLYAKYFGGAAEDGGGLRVKVYKNPFNPSKVVVTVEGETDGMEGVCRRLSHYGKYSELVFKGGRVMKKEIDDTENGIIYELKNARYGFKVKNALTLREIADEAENSRVVFIGERHDSFAHHANQLALIKLLFSKSPDLAIGMEMFQRPFQKVLDDYIDGVISERDMLKKSEYFKRWRFDYNLYRPILSFARENGIRVIALNAPAEATGKTAGEGLASLSAGEREYLPEDLDYSNPDYRADLENIFAVHTSHINFNNFMEAQLLWDETMAAAAAENLKKTGGRMVILAGNGHIRRGYGIPERLKRRTDLPYVSIVQDEDAEVGMADYVLYPDELKGIESPKLGVAVKTEDGRVEVESVTEGTPASKAGLEKGDIINKMDFFDINDLEDLRIALFYAGKGANVSFTVLRGGGEIILNTEF